MNRVCLTPDDFQEEQVVIEGAEAHHLGQVLRVRVGETFVATDGLGTEYLLEATRVSKRSFEASVRSRTSHAPGPGQEVTLAIAPPKGSRMETAIEKCVEVGVGRIVPVLTNRSVVKSRDESGRTERWGRVARAATGQSLRSHLPVIDPIVSFDEAMRTLPAGATYLAHAADTASPWIDVVRQRKAGEPFAVVIGPEGGFTEEELELAERFQVREVSLGRTRLRSETAAIVAVSLAIASLTPSQGG